MVEYHVVKDMSTTQAAEALGISLRAVVRWYNRGLFPNAYKLHPHLKNSPIRIPFRDVQAILDARHGEMQQASSHAR